jgi:hypothetical protein
MADSSVCHTAGSAAEKYRAARQAFYRPAGQRVCFDDWEFAAMRLLIISDIPMRR